MLNNKFGKKIKKYGIGMLVTGMLLAPVSNTIYAQENNQKEIYQTFNQIKQEIDYFSNELDEEIKDEEITSTDYINEIDARNKDLIDILIDEKINDKRVNESLEHLINFKSNIKDLEENKENKEYIEFLNYIKSNTKNYIDDIKTKYDF